MKRLSLELIDYSLHAINTSWWKALMSLFLKPGTPFEIRCWREETDVIETAASFGTISNAQSTEFEVSVTGVLTNSTIHQILSEPKPDSEEQMTRFFTIHVGNSVWCEHYGTEIYIDAPTDAVYEQLRTILEPIRDYFVFGEYDIGK